MSTQAIFEARISAELPPPAFAASGELQAAAFIGNRVVEIIGSIAQSAIGIAAELPSRLNDATFNMLVSAAKVVLTTTLTAMGLSPALITAAIGLLVALIEQYHTGS